MTSGQRKIHKIIWIVLVIIIPILMFFSIKDLNIFSLEKNTTSQLIDSKKVSLKSAENNLVKVSVYESSIEIILKSTLKNSSSIIYEIDEKGNKSNVIGQLTTAGIYSFNIQNIPKGIIINDDLKNIEITKLLF